MAKGLPAARRSAFRFRSSVRRRPTCGFFGVSVESDTLALSQASNSASGVGVKLTYGNNPGAAVPDGTSVKINEASNLPILKRVTGASAGTAEAINFNAQYVQTDATVGAGTANSMVTFALEYN
jgi:type 1 fimbria pilin